MTYKTAQQELMALMAQENKDLRAERATLLENIASQQYLLNEAKQQRVIINRLQQEKDSANRECHALKDELEKLTRTPVNTILDEQSQNAVNLPTDNKFDGLLNAWFPTDKMLPEIERLKKLNSEQFKRELDLINSENELRQQVGELIEENESLRTINLSLSDELNKANQEINRLAIIVNQEKEKHDEILIENGRLNNQVTELTEHVNQLTEQPASAQLTAIVSRTVIQNLRDEIETKERSLNNIIQNLRNELKALGNIFNELQKEKNSLQFQLTRAEKTHEIDCQQLHKLDIVEGELSKARQEKEQAQLTLLSYQNDIYCKNDSQSQILRIQSRQLECQAGRIKNLQYEIKNLKEDLRLKQVRKSIPGSKEGF